MPIIVYLNFDGNCRQAVEFYAQVFHTDPPKILTFGSMPAADHPIPEEAKDRVLHTELVIGGSVVMFSDTMPGMPFTSGNNISLTFASETQDEVTRAFDRLKEGGAVTMPLQATFWSKCYGMVTDRFGIHWQLSLTEHP